MGLIFGCFRRFRLISLDYIQRAEVDSVQSTWWKSVIRHT